MDSGLLTASELAVILGVKPQTVWQWKRRGLLAPAGLDHRKRPLYRQLDGAHAEKATRQRAGRRE